MILAVVVVGYRSMERWSDNKSAGTVCRREVEQQVAGLAPVRTGGYDPRADLWVICMSKQPGEWQCPANDPREFQGQEPRPASFCYRGPDHEFTASADNPFVAETTYVR